MGYGVDAETRQMLLAVLCPWCKASVGEPCSVVGGRREVTTLAGRSHDARWQAALNMGAPVLTERVRALHGPF